MYLAGQSGSWEVAEDLLVILIVEDDPLIQILVGRSRQIKSAIRQIQSSSQDVTQHQNRPVRPDGTESGIRKETLH